MKMMWYFYFHSQKNIRYKIIHIELLHTYSSLSDIYIYIYIYQLNEDAVSERIIWDVSRYFLNPSEELLNL